MEDLNFLWNKVLSKLELQVTTVSYEIWIKPIELLEYKDNKTLILVATNSTAKHQLLRNHYDKIKESVCLIFNPDSEIEIIDQNEKQEYLKNKKEENKEIEEEISPEKIKFNQKYTFENFIVGSGNQAVSAACRAVAENPGKYFNPLFIYGGVGLGKTHLLHAIGNYIISQNSKLKIKYVTCENFTNDYIESMLSKGEKNKMEFREKYRGLDVLLIDDIQFLANKESTQEEFFHTFNDLYQNGKQIVLSSDRPPKEITTLTERLVSRFSSGYIQDIQPPDYETRIAILKKKAQQERYFIDDDAIIYIAERINTNIREMEGLLSKVHFLASLLGKKTATIEEAKQALNDEKEVVKESLTMDRITNTVCDYFKVSKYEIIGKKRSKEIVEPRMYAIYLIIDILDIPLIAIGKYFGGRDHTTIIHARDKITEQLKKSKETRKIINDIKNIISINS